MGTTYAGLPVELVIQTTSSILQGRFAPREAVTILATQTPQATVSARQLARIDPERASAYADILRAIGREVRATRPNGPAPCAR